MVYKLLCVFLYGPANVHSKPTSLGFCFALFLILRSNQKKKDNVNKKEILGLGKKMNARYLKNCMTMVNTLIYLRNFFTC